MKIIYMGSGGFGLPTLQALHMEHEIALIVTQPDRPAGRNRRLTPTPIAQWASQENLPLIKPDRVNAPATVEQISAMGADANVVVAYGQKIGDSIIASPRYGRVATMNLHASLLPKYRGAAPIHWALICGEQVTGNTVFSLVEEMDAGPVLGMEQTQIEPINTTGDLLQRLSVMGPQLVLNVLDQLHRGILRPMVQDESLVTLAPKLHRRDTYIDFNKPAFEIARRINGLSPWPGVMVQFSMQGQATKSLKLLRVEPLTVQHPPGMLFSNGLIGTGQGSLRLLEVQSPGKSLMKWEDFNRGQPIACGTQFTSIST